MRRKSSPKRSVVETSLHKGPLNPKESRDRINEMIKYIELVIEKRLAQLEAEEESAIEKCRAEEIQGPKQEIDKEFAKKCTAAKRETKLHHSKALQSARIAILTAGERLMEKIVKETKERLRENLATNFSKYMQPLLVQSALRILEPDIYLRIRPSDGRELAKMTDIIEHKLYNISGIKFKIYYLDNYLDEDDIGRMIVYNKKLNVFVNNSLVNKVDEVAKRILAPLIASSLMKKGRHLQNYRNMMNMNVDDSATESYSGITAIFKIAMM